MDFIEIEKAKSNNSKCKDCEKSIKKGEYRAKLETSMFLYFYCLECAFKVCLSAIKEMVKHLNIKYVYFENKDYR